MSKREAMDLIQMDSEHSSLNAITVVMIGSIGSGKSCTGNTIVGSRQFRSNCGSKPETQASESYTVVIPENEVNVTVIDTPGLRNAKDFLKLKDDIVDKKPDKHKLCVFLFVIRIGR
ncbi:Hypothetical predicted protein [Mytilus galloprovincialis]|uniref:AIG1-type G domain-containing protein n=1 Tax=Mytilus galloprovincialis TaxID=29158 RepID=A0A8B6G1T0_MYTGA|nr:Hypothetical predicted protein [Mytilus galloprovincialis]